MTAKSAPFLAQALTYAGALPFWLAVITLACGASVGGFEPRWVAALYGGIIVSFIAGIHWAIHLFFAERCPFNLLFTSNVVALLAWGLIVLYPKPWVTFAAEAMLFLALLTVDYALNSRGLLPPWFFGLRQRITVLVVTALGLLAVLA